MPDQPLSARMTRLATKRGRVPALVTALGILALLAVQQVLSALIHYLGYVSFLPANSSNGLYGATPFEPFSSALDIVLRISLPFAAGVFLSLWVLAPISDELTLRYAATRAGLASVAGSLVVAVVALVITLVRFTGSALRGTAQPLDLLTEVISDVITAANVFIFTTPVVILAGLLLWWWLKEHPRDYAVVGLVDEL